MVIIPTFDGGDRQYGEADYQRIFFQCDGEGGGFDHGGFHNDFNKRGKDLVH